MYVFTLFEMAEISVTSSEENKCALKIPITRKNSSKSHSGSESSELLLSGDDTCSSSGFRSGQTSDLGRITICRSVFFKEKTNIHFIFYSPSK